MKTTKTAKGFEIFVYLWRHKILLCCDHFRDLSGFLISIIFLPNTNYKSLCESLREKRKYLEAQEDAKKDKLDIEKILRNLHAKVFDVKTRRRCFCHRKTKEKLTDRKV